MIRYINPFIDYGFKKLFASEGNKDILISFLNAVIEDVNDPVIDLTYKNVEQIGEFNGSRRSYFDVYCETSSGRRFIVEMQNTWKPFFKDRTLYYAAQAIRDQGAIEKADFLPEKEENKENAKDNEVWNYRLNEVYLIAVMNFNFSKKEYGPDDYYHRVMLTDLQDHHVFYDKLTLIYLEMPKVGKAKLDMERPLDRWLRALYWLWDGKECPSELDEQVFQKLFQQAEYARFNSDQRLTYIRSRKYCLDTYNEIKGGRILGRIEGREEGRKEGREEGREEGRLEGYRWSRIEIAKRMKALGVDKETIVKSVELTAEEYENL